MLPTETTRATLYKAILEEAAGRSLPELSEPGWMQQGGGYDMVSGLDRLRVNEEARRFYHVDPTVRHMVQLRNGYTFGRGVTLRAADELVDEFIQNDFWNHPLNKRVISRAAAQYRLNRDLMLDGELFCLLLTNRITGRVVVRVVKPQSIQAIIYTPNDRLPAGYQVRIRKAEGHQDILVPDWMFDGDDAVQRNQTAQHFGANTNVAMMHVIYNEFNGGDGQIRGISPLSVSVPWIKALKGFMEDRATLSLAASTFAFRMQVKGNRQAVERVRTQWGNYDDPTRYYPQADGRERRQGANTFIGNDAVNLEQMRFDTAAANAYQDMRMFRQQVGIGQGVFEHYLGDPSTGNLATATAMELPMRKLYEYEQQFWSDVFTDMATYALTQAFRFGKLRPNLGVYRLDMSTGYPLQTIVPAGGIDLSIDTQFPPIVESDVSVYSAALNNIASAEAVSGSVMLPPEAKARIALRAFGQARDTSRYMQTLEDTNYMPQNQPERPTQPVQEADTSERLPRNEAVKVGRITKSEVEQAFDDWDKLPTLESLAKRLGVDVEDLDS